MKIRFWDRLILFFGALLTILAGAALVVAGLQIKGVLAEGFPLWVRVVCLAVGALIIVFGGYVILFPRRYAVRRQEFVVQKTENGELRIAVKAIESLVQKCIDLHEEIRVLTMNILNSREGVVVELNVSLANNISIPLAVASLQKQIKQYLIASSGIEVKEVKVSVESTQDDLPVCVPTEEEAEEENGAPAREKKLPLHQRLFGRADQPAIVPEPPKEEEPAEAEPAEEPKEDEIWKRPEEETAEANPPVVEPAPEISQEAPAEEPAAEEPETEQEAPAMFEAAEESPAEEPALTEEPSPEEEPLPVQEEKNHE